MKTLFASSLASLLLLALVVGCHRQKKSGSLQDFEARLSAAQTITATSDRDAALESVAADSAEFGAGDVVKKAIMAISSTSARDDAAHQAALKLAKAGKRADAKEVAQLIVTTSTRDDTLKTLAEGSE